MKDYKNVEVRLDGSYVIEKNGMPYHVPNMEEWAEEHANITAWAKQNAHNITYEQLAIPTLDEAKATAHITIANQASSAITAGFMHEGMFYSYELTDQQNFVDMYNTITLNTRSIGIEWSAYKSPAKKKLTRKLFTHDEFKALYYAGVMHKSDILSHATALKQAIDEAETVAEVEAINIAF